MSRVLDHISGQPRPTMRGLLHVAALALFVPTSVALLVRAGTSRLPVAVYLACLLTVLSVSAGYHLLARTPRAQVVMSRIDRGAIFLVIAGTYTPVLLVAVPSPVSAVLLALVWLLAAAGAAGRLAGRLPRLSSAMYIVVGWLALLALPWLFAYSWQLTLGLLVGGILFTVGAAMFAARRPVAWPRVFGFHEVFHAFTVGGFATHFLCVAALVGVAGSAG